MTTRQKKTGSGVDASEQRGSARRAVAWSAELTLDDREPARRVHTSNIGAGGLMFSLAGPARVPANLEITLTLPTGETLMLSGAVRHVARRQDSSDFDIGVQFAGLDQTQRTRLDAALASLPN